MSFWVVFTCTIAVQLFVLWRLRFDGWTLGIVLGGMLLSASYLLDTTISERNYDGSSHVEYIQALAERWRIPDVRSCGVCGHPPLYYGLAALWSKLLGIAGLPLERGLQWLSFVLFFGFVVFSLLIFRSCIKDPRTQRLATALVVFWPSSVINSVRVHNDALASLLMLASMYFTAEWDRQDRSRYFYAALCASTLAIFTKASGYAMAATLLSFAVFRLFETTPGTKTGRRQEAPRELATALLVLGGALLLVAFLRESDAPRPLCQTVFGSACDGRYVPPTPDTLGHFVRFDVVDFVRRLDTVPGDPFLNRFMKSSLFGVMPLGEEFSGARYDVLAASMSLLLLAMVAVCALVPPFLGKLCFRKYRVYLASSLILFASLLVFRVRVPNEFHEDFRHIYPVLVPFCLAYATIVQRVGKASKLLSSLGVAIALAMVASSIAFFT